MTQETREGLDGVLARLAVLLPCSAVKKLSLEAAVGIFRRRCPPLEDSSDPWSWRKEDLLWLTLLPLSFE